MNDQIRTRIIKNVPVPTRRLLVFFSWILAGCAPISPPPTQPALLLPSPTIPRFITATSSPTSTPAQSNSTGAGPTAIAPTGTQSPTANRPAIPAPEATALAAEAPPFFAEEEFSTDFSIHSVSYAEVYSGGPPRDGISPLDEPGFIPSGEADLWLDPQEPVILLQVGADIRAYPLQIILYHEIVNDTVGGIPVAVTFCPLCNTAIVFERTVGGEILSFSTTGRLRYSNLLMYDRQTESWWQQATGDAVIGTLTGTQLTMVPANIIAWADFLAAYPDGKVLSRETGHNRPYGDNPYLGYDAVGAEPWAYLGPPISGKLPPLARVLTIERRRVSVAYPYETLRANPVINDQVGEDKIVVFWQPGARTPFSSVKVAEGQEVGAAAAFFREIRGQTLTFMHENGTITDLETGSQWDITGRAIAGPLNGFRLKPVVAVNHFWFSWAAFKPETIIFELE